VSKWNINRDMTKVKINYNSNLHLKINNEMSKSKIDLLLCICVLFYSSFVVHLRMHISTLKQHWRVRGPLRECRSIQPGASGLPYYCASICVRSGCTQRARCVNSKPKKINNTWVNPKDHSEEVGRVTEEREMQGQRGWRRRGARERESGREGFGENSA